MNERLLRLLPGVNERLLRLLPGDRSWDCTANLFLHRHRSATSGKASRITDENGRERSGKLLNRSRNCIFFCRERKRERKNRTGKRNRYYGISGTESIGREHADYNRESMTQNGKIHTTTSNI